MIKKLGKTLELFSMYNCANKIADESERELWMKINRIRGRMLFGDMELVDALGIARRPFRKNAIPEVAYQYGVSKKRLRKLLKRIKNEPKYGSEVNHAQHHS